MSFSTAPFTTILGWCETNKCSRIEITNLDNGFVQTLFVWKNHEIVFEINTTSLISSIEIKKEDGEDSKNIIFHQEGVLLNNCLEILEFTLKDE